MKSAELIAVGTELLVPGGRDTNTEWLTQRLAGAGIRVLGRAAVGDDPERIASAVSVSLSRADLVIVCGGLGPTDDDRTREGVARALGVGLERDPATLRHLEERARRRGLPFTTAHARQADRPKDARWIDNAVGSAPGFLHERADEVLVVLPGVPAEMTAMFDDHVLPWLAGRADRALAHRVLKVAGRPESWVDARLGDVAVSPGLTVTVLARTAGVEVHLLVEAASRDGAAATADDVERRVAALLGDDLYGRGDETLPEVVGSLLRGAGGTLATAESCTAGLLAGSVTAAAGSSRWFRGGLVVYSDDLKVSLAGVRPATLERHGAVSEAVACELARGARERCGASVGLGVTGVAGPGGGSPEKPVGLVHVALSDPSGASSRRFRFGGDRERVRGLAVTAALDLVRRSLRGRP